MYFKNFEFGGKFLKSKTKYQTNYDSKRIDIYSMEENNWNHISLIGNILMKYLKNYEMFKTH